MAYNYDIPFHVDLTDRVALVTGGNGGIGGMFCRALAACGATVIVLGRNLERCQKVADEINAGGGKADAISGDVTDEAAMLRVKDEIAQKYVKDFRTKIVSLDDQIGSLSGGNQQKVVIARSLSTTPKVVILDEPTRGIDVGAKRDIYLLLGKLVQQGKAVIMISSEIPELMGVCDRIMVMCEGNLSGEVQRGEFSQERIMTLASAIEV